MSALASVTDTTNKHTVTQANTHTHLGRCFFENRPIFHEDMPKILLVRFFPDTV